MPIRFGNDSLLIRGNAFLERQIAYGLKDFSTVFAFTSCFAVTAGNFRYFIPNVGVTGWARDDCKVASKFNG